MNRTIRPRPLLAFVLLVAVLPFGLASCASDRPGDGASTTASGIGAKWGSCMRDAGFEVSDPSDDLVRSGLVQQPQGVDQERFATAAAACKEQLGIAVGGTVDKDKWVREYAQVASCIRENGYPDYPEQQPGALNGDPEEYPRAAEPYFEEVRLDCMAKYSPDTKTQQLG